MKWSKVGLCAAALLAVAGTTGATPLRLDYCVDDLGGGQFRYTFHLVLDNNDGSWVAGQGFGWIIFGDADGSQGPATSPINDFVGDPSYFPIGPFTNYQGSGGGHNGPTLGPVVVLMPPYPPNLWVPNAVGDSITWGGTAAESIGQGQMLWSNLFAGGGAGYANFEVGHFLGSCNGGGSTCYANCDLSTTVPFLNVNDFICFQGKFAAGDTYANCDMSTQPPVLNVNDFICFQSKFAAGCSAP